MGDLRAIDEYPDINFIDGYTIGQLENDMVAWFLEKRKELTGEDMVLANADDRRLLLQTGAYFIFQGYMFSDDAGKMGLLKYSRGDFLENLGALKHIYREHAVGATTTLRFSLEEPRQAATGIPEGTRVTAGDGVYFSTDGYGEILPGETYVDIGATCMTAGSAGNDYGIGDIKNMVDRVAFIDSVANITKPANGADIESDESLRERIYAAPSAYSTAGTVDAYKYHVRKFNSGIADILVTSPEPCVVEIRYLLADGEIPNEESLNSLMEYLSDPLIKPLTDQIYVLAPEGTEYDLSLTYYINQSERNQAGVIQDRVNTAIKEYKSWQCAVLGRDINPDELVKRVMTAGAKRVEVSSPRFTVIPKESVAMVKSETVIYGGLEDD